MASLPLTHSSTSLTHSLHSLHHRPEAMAPARAHHLLACLLASALLAAATPVTGGGLMTDQLEVLFGQTQLLNDSNGDQTIALTLDRVMGSAFKSKTSYLFARIDMDIKLVADDSAGTVTTIYVSDHETAAAPAQ